MDISFLKLLITIKLHVNVADRYALFGIRERFSKAFRQISHCSRINCDGCAQSPNCPCFHAFSQSLSRDPSAAKRYQKPPLPFVFHLPLLPSLPTKGTLCEIGLVLVGSAANHCAEYLKATRQMIQEWRVAGKQLGDIVKIEAEGYQKERHLVMEHGDTAPNALVLLSLNGLLSSNSLSTHELMLSLITPLRLMHEGQPLRQLIPERFINALMRRVSALGYYYSRTELDYDFKWLARQSSQAGFAEAEFRWTEWTRSLSGVVGHGCLCGDLTEFHPFLLLGEYVSVGKAASFGLGRYLLHR